LFPVAGEETQDLRPGIDRTGGVRFLLTPVVTTPGDTRLTGPGGFALAGPGVPHPLHRNVHDVLVRHAVAPLVATDDGSDVADRGRPETGSAVGVGGGEAHRPEIRGAVAGASLIMDATVVLPVDFQEGRRPAATELWVLLATLCPCCAALPGALVIRPCHRGEGGEFLGYLAGELGDEATAVAHARGVDAQVVNLVGGGDAVDEVPDQGQVLLPGGSGVGRSRPGLVYAVGVGDDGTVPGEIAEAGDGFAGLPIAVEGEDQRLGPG